MLQTDRTSTQTKGRKAGPGAGASGGDRAIQEGGLKEVAENLKVAVLRFWKGPVLLELLFAGRASRGCQKVLDGEKSNETLREIVQVLGPYGYAIVMMRAELDSALGRVFGGIAARCGED